MGLSVGIVPVVDRRLDKLAGLAESKQKVYTDVKVVDIAGLVRGASKGEGLGNQFLANIRETDAILHVVRCFEDPNVVHVEHTVDPARDIEIIETELLLADLDTLTKRIERVSKTARDRVRIRFESAHVETGLVRRERLGIGPRPRHRAREEGAADRGGKGWGR